MKSSPLRPTSTLAIRTILHAAIASTLGLGMGCGRDEVPPATPGASGKPAVATSPPGTIEKKEYKLVGVIMGMNAEAEEVRIRHEEIRGFMGAMTMPFKIKDPKVFETMRTGDRVEGKLRVEEEGGMVKDYDLADLAVVAGGAEPAPGAPPGDAPAVSENELTVSLAGGAPTLRVRPRALQVGEAVPDFTMTDQDGRPFKLSDLRGNVVALTFVYTRCPLPDFCPLMDRKFSELAQRIERSPKRKGQIRLVSLSFDPEHDTPEVLKKHAELRGAHPPLWTYAVASHPELAKVAPRVGLVYGPGRDEIMHNLCTVVIDPAGKLARLEIGTSRNKWEPTDILKTIDSFIQMPGT